MDGFHLSEVVAALSHALDLTEGQPAGHAGRTCLLGMRLGEAAGLSEEALSDLYYALLLKDSGCSSSSARITQLFGVDDIEMKRIGKLVDWTKPTEALRHFASSVRPGESPLARARQMISVAAELARNGDAIVEPRCERGAKIVMDLGFPPASAAAVRNLDEHWDGKGKPAGLKGDEIPVLARIACLAQTAEVFFAGFGLETARAMVRARRGKWFEPDLCDHFLAISDGDLLWLRMTDPDATAHVAQREPDLILLGSDDERLDRIATAFAEVIDAKSPYTANHSRGVAEFAVGIGVQFGFDDIQLRDIRRAGLLHDIGKLGIPNSILDKPAKLTDVEYLRIKEHPAYTEQILSRVTAFSSIAFAAAAHHERVDGRGYHRGVGGDDLPREARVLAVADVFEALTANRPYRGGFEQEEALSIMRKDVGSAFCPEAFAAHEAALSASTVREIAPR